MEIKIPLPASTSANTYKELKGYLKQLELAVHHAQKAVDNAEQTGIEITENSFVLFEHPSLSYLARSTEMIALKDIEDNLSEELQNIELRIYLA